ncbi:MAG: hypothetical protein K9K37_11405 [Desulfocapsa sp.]|nr:hypothetical protein [Desulfocapsa sp.]
MTRSKLFISMIIIFFFTTLIIRPATAAGKTTSWTMFMVPIITSATKSRGGLTLRLVNNTMPHFRESATSKCSLEHRDSKDLLICTSATLRYDADENDGSTRIRRTGHITFNPVGSCSNGVCLVSPLPLGSETITQWVWFNTYWKQVVNVTQPIDWTDSSYPFDQKTAMISGETIGVTTAQGSASWTLFLVPSLTNE